MPKDVKIWEVHSGDRLAELAPARLDLEERIETWLEQDISIISDDLLVIGRQVSTSFGGVIDLLCLDGNGDTVIVELKRDRTPRDITAQVLDYASWVQDLSSDRLVESADQYLADQGPLEDAFARHFGEQLPETLNGHHSMMVVASDLDPSTERILNYLSDTYGVDINAVTFEYFRHAEQREFLARVFLIEPSQVAYSRRTKSTSKRRELPSYEDFQKVADDNGVGDLYRSLFAQLRDIFDRRSKSKTSVSLIGDMDGRQNTIFNILPEFSTPEDGLRYRVFIDRLAEYMRAEKQQLLASLPPNTADYEPWSGSPPCVAGYFETEEDVERFTSYLSRLRKPR